MAATGLGSGESSPPDLQTATFLLFSHMMETRSLLIRALIPSRGLYPHDLTPPKAPSQNIIALGLGLQHVDLGGKQAVNPLYHLHFNNFWNSLETFTTTTLPVSLGGLYVCKPSPNTLLTQEVRPAGTLAVQTASCLLLLTPWVQGSAQAMVCFTHPVRVHGQPSPCLLLQVLLEIEFGAMK